MFTLSQCKPDFKIQLEEQKEKPAQYGKWKSFFLFFFFDKSYENNNDLKAWIDGESGMRQGGRAWKLNILLKIFEKQRQLVFTTTSTSLPGVQAELFQMTHCSCHWKFNFPMTPRCWSVGLLRRGFTSSLGNFFAYNFSLTPSVLRFFILN